MASETDRAPDQDDSPAGSGEPIALYTVALLFGPAVGFMFGVAGRALMQVFGVEVEGLLLGFGGGGGALLLGLFGVMLLQRKDSELAAQLDERVAKALYM